MLDTSSIDLTISVCPPFYPHTHPSDSNPGRSCAEECKSRSTSSTFEREQLANHQSLRKAVGDESNTASSRDEEAGAGAGRVAKRRD